MSYLKPLASFKATCLFVGTLNLLMAGSMLAQGVMAGMAEFKVPAALLASPHYDDAMSWVFLHMCTIGALILLIGLLAEDPAKKVWAARALVLIHCVYAVLDVQTSDNPFGNSLYQGPRSVFPVFIDVLYLLLFLRLSLPKKGTTTRLGPAESR